MNYPKEISSILEEYADIFSKPEGLPPNGGRDHVIHLIPNAHPVNVKPYRYAHFQKQEMEKLVIEMLSEGIIRPSSSPFSSPILLVHKKDGTWRFCVDYRALNAITARDWFPIPTIDELFDELHGVAFFSKLDLLDNLLPKGKTVIMVVVDRLSKYEYFSTLPVLPWAEYYYNTSFQTSAGMTPFEILYRCPPPTIPRYIKGSTGNNLVEQHMLHRDEVLVVLKQNLTKAQGQMKSLADKHRREAPFQVGDWVYAKLKPYRQNSVFTMPSQVRKKIFWALQGDKARGRSSLQARIT
ncbi:hypothetical protein H6P81_005845 [Aristolochia fimbriata]|uniref:Reverse transcriptase n=1 Tax=Aristolochia fimbriata TaxID=158543 RepID=A0AAV7EZC6_ARIFI|nr:hypothetical protein H6P81_005845 [Aristolochia fimbriata]